MVSGQQMPQVIALSRYTMIGVFGLKEQVLVTPLPEVEPMLNVEQ